MELERIKKHKKNKAIEIYETAKKNHIDVSETDLSVTLGLIDNSSSVDEVEYFFSNYDQMVNKLYKMEVE